MSKNSELDKLFIKWRDKYAKQDGFKPDGIIDENLYPKAKHKILFITKEPNDPDKGSDDFREWWQEEIYYSFSYRIAEWAYGILNNFPPYDKIWPKNDNKLAHNALKSIAFMNVKKSGGLGASNKLEINQIIERDRELIHKEIRIINPEIIILGLSWDSSVDLLFPNLNWKTTGYLIKVANYGNSKVIDFYHPSSRSSAVAMYCLLEKIINSSEFISL